MLDGLNFGRLQVVLSGKAGFDDVEIGSVRLECNERSFVVDTGYTELLYNDDSDTTTVTCHTDLEDIKDLFGDTTKFNLKKKDLLDEKLKCEVYIAYDEDVNKILSMGLEVMAKGAERIIDCKEE